MTSVPIKDLIHGMLVRPRDAARQVIALNLSTQVLWMALALISIMMSAIVSGLFHLIPIPDAGMAELIQSMLFYSAPLGFALLNLGNAILSIFVLFWSGRLFGGTGTIREILSVVVLFQATVIALLLGISVISLLLPLVSAFVFLAFVVWVLWAMVSIIDVAHRLDNIGKAIAVFLMATIVVPLGLQVIIGVLAAPFIGVS